MRGAEGDRGERGGHASRRATTAAWAFIAALSVAHLLYYAPRTVDDMFIFLRYAENLAAGHGLVYNIGERVEGFSSPLWVLLLAVGEVIGLGGVSWSKALALAAWGSLLWGAYVFSSERLGLSPRLALVGCVALALNSYLVSWTLWGLETPAYLALLIWVMILAGRVTDGAGVRQRRASIALGVVGSAFVLSRPEAPLFIGLIGASEAVRSLKRDELMVRVRRALPAAGSVIAVFLGYVAFRRAYYGLWLPHTHYAKEGGGFDPARLEPLVAQGAFITESASFVLAAIGALWMAKRRRSAAPLAVLVGSCFFVGAVATDWMPNVRHFLPVQILVPLAVLFVAQELGEAREKWKRMTSRAVVALVLANAIVIASYDARYSVFDFMTHGREESWIRFKSPRAIADTWDCLVRVRPEHVEGMDAFNNGMITQLYDVIEADARPLEETWFVGRDIGRVGWLAPVRVFDTAGLFTPDVVRSVSGWQEEAVGDDLVQRAFDREVVMTALGLPWVEAVWRSDDLKRAYAPNPDWSRISLRARARPSRQQVLARYEYAVSKLPGHYYLMTLYGEGVGAAVERRYEHVRGPHVAR